MGADFLSDQLLHHIDLAPCAAQVPCAEKLPPCPAAMGLKPSLHDHFVGPPFAVCFCQTNFSSKMGAGKCPSVFDFHCQERSGTVIFLSQLFSSQNSRNSYECSVCLFQLRLMKKLTIKEKAKNVVLKQKCDNYCVTKK